MHVWGWQGPGGTRVQGQAATSAGAGTAQQDSGSQKLPANTLLAITTATVGDRTLNMAVLKNDEHVGATVLRTKSVYQPRVLEAMLKYVKPGDVVVEGGANLGTYTVFFADRVGAEGRVIAFEPQNFVFNVLCTNALLNNQQQVEGVKGAIFYKDGSVKTSSKEADGAAHGAQMKDAIAKGLTTNYGGTTLGTDGNSIPAYALDSFQLERVSAAARPAATAPASTSQHLQPPLPQAHQQQAPAGVPHSASAPAQAPVLPPSLPTIPCPRPLLPAPPSPRQLAFMKLDVQGAEPLAIYGARATIKRCLPVISTEYAQVFGGDEWQRQYTKDAGIPPEVASFNHIEYLKSLGYTEGAHVQDEFFWLPPGFKQ
jgi:FkbM family methyltransferase